MPSRKLTTATMRERAHAGDLDLGEEVARTHARAAGDEAHRANTLSSPTKRSTQQRRLPALDGAHVPTRASSDSLGGAAAGGGEVAPRSTAPAAVAGPRAGRSCRRARRVRRQRSRMRADHDGERAVPLGQRAGVERDRPRGGRSDDRLVESVAAARDRRSDAIGRRRARGRSPPADRSTLSCPDVSVPTTLVRMQAVRQ